MNHTFVLGDIRDAPTPKVTEICIRLYDPPRVWTLIGGKDRQEDILTTVENSLRREAALDQFLDQSCIFQLCAPGNKVVVSNKSKIIQVITDDITFSRKLHEQWLQWCETQHPPATLPVRELRQGRSSQLVRAAQGMSGDVHQNDNSRDISVSPPATGPESVDLDHDSAEATVGTQAARPGDGYANQRNASRVAVPGPTVIGGMFVDHGVIQAVIPDGECSVTNWQVGNGGMQVFGDEAVVFAAQSN